MKTIIEKLCLQEYGDKYFALRLDKVHSDFELSRRLGIEYNDLACVMKRARKVENRGITYFTTRQSAENVLTALKMFLMFREEA